MAKSRANPVRARSPPDISDTACRRLPRGCAISSTPVSRGSPPSSASTSRSSARPPSKRRWKISPKWRLISSNAWANRACAVRGMPRSAFSRSFIDALRSSYLVPRDGRAPAGAPPCLAPPLAPLAELGLPLLRLSHALGNVGLHLVQPRQLAGQRVRALGHGGHVHAARAQLGDQLGLTRLCGLDGGAGGGHGGLLPCLGLARRLHVLLEPRQQGRRLLHFRLHLVELAAERLEVALHALVLADSLLDVLLAAHALGLACLHVVVDAAEPRAP